ncbi:hypothetical protein C6P45_004853 [Maudiozyma exigua]|uniref:Uncharacterized protein n=1 Tax=Maudiozyma exigua TaxID=34358 RepID=A0A9P7BAV3_MAUEX|nr:hypothetical protein C6P45_004853 [Kazachstania exigua]
MGEEISLSLEETNKLRLQLGLKPIVPTGSSLSHSSAPLLSKTDATQEPNVNRFIEDDKINNIRKRLNKASQKILLDSKSQIDSESNWLNKVGSQINKRYVNLSFNSQHNSDEDEGDIPTLKLSHKLDELQTGKDIILTLKDKDVRDDNSDDDVLEDESITTFKRVSKNIKLKDMNKERRRKKLNMSVSSKDIDAQESDKEDNNGTAIKINAITAITEHNLDDMSNGEKRDDGKNKIKVVFSETEGESSDNGDFKIAKIKKRKVKDSKQIKKRKRVELPAVIQKVQLIDEDSAGEDILDVRVNSHTNNSNIKTLDPVEDVGIDIRKDALENRRREMEIKRLRNNRNVKSSTHGGLIIDETSSFLTKLDARLIHSDEEEAEIALDDDIFADNDAGNLPSETQHSEMVESNSNIEIERQTAQNGSPNFFGGLASTLHFLQDRNVLPKKLIDPDVIDKANDEEVLKLKRKIEMRELENEIGKKDHSNESVQKSKDVISHIQSELLKDYNPEINLVYKDDNGNHLTTKEAYKKLSQRFHGTKSNRAKQDKFTRKVQQRNKKNQSEMQSNFFDSL